MYERTTQAERGLCSLGLAGGRPMGLFFSTAAIFLFSFIAILAADLWTGTSVLGRSKCIRRCRDSRFLAQPLDHSLPEREQK